MVITMIDYSPLWENMKCKLLKSGIDNKTLDSLKTHRIILDSR